MIPRRAAAFALGVLGVAGCAWIADLEDVSYVSNAGAAFRDAGGDRDSQPDDPDDPDAANDAADGGADPCDLDRDEARAAACGGGDCNDGDPRVHPDAGFVTDLPPPGNDGDWDCDGVVSKQYPRFVACAGSEDCAATSGFAAEEPGCGAMGDFFVCAVVQGTCSLAGFERRAQGCR